MVDNLQLYDAVLIESMSHSSLNTCKISQCIAFSDIILISRYTYIPRGSFRVSPKYRCYSLLYYYFSFDF